MHPFLRLFIKRAGVHWSRFDDNPTISRPKFQWTRNDDSNFLYSLVDFSVKGQHVIDGKVNTSLLLIFYCCPTKVFVLETQMRKYLELKHYF